MNAIFRAIMSGEGQTEIWYMNEEFFRDGLMGVEWCRERKCLPDPQNLGKTHVLLGRIPETELERIYMMMQGEVWSPEGEANELIRSKGLHHTSMSMGDMVVVDGTAFMVDTVGFVELGDTR